MCTETAFLFPLYFQFKNRNKGFLLYFDLLHIEAYENEYNVELLNK